ncbi:MAG TPA: hypothetical protein VMU04_02515, partial [Candidatus Acidoferrum sp.]|nr:hypothetical protein [Candidatus Acidoferrum sp.]
MIPLHGRGPWGLSLNLGNIQHPTSNIQHPMGAARAAIGCWMLDVGCWMFPSRPGLAPFRISG